MHLDIRDIRESLTPNRLHLILLPTEACNFRCVYCYEAFRLKRMALPVVTGVKRLLERRVPALDDLTISWFGGEPLLARDIMEDILGHVSRLRRDRPGPRFASDATTNGSCLTLPVLETLVRLGVSDYQVSFDGPREWHDRKRVRPGGLPTFDLVWENLLACRRSTTAFRVMVRLHVDQENAAAIPGFLEEYREAFGGDRRFTLYIRGLSRLGGPNDSTLPILEGEQRAGTIEELRRLATERGLRQAHVPPGTTICYAAKGNSFVIRADGRVNKCTVALDHPSNQVGTLQPDGTFRLASDRMRPWLRGFETGERAELSCPMRGLAESAPNSSFGPARVSDDGAATDRAARRPLAVSGGSAR